MASHVAKCPRSTPQWKGIGRWTKVRAVGRIERVRKMDEEYREDGGVTEGANARVDACPDPARKPTPPQRGGGHPPLLVVVFFFLS